MNDFRNYLNEQLKDEDFGQEWADSESEYMLARAQYITEENKLPQNILSDDAKSSHDNF